MVKKRKAKKVVAKVVIKNKATGSALIGALIVDFIGAIDFWNPTPFDIGALITPLYVWFAFETTPMAVLGFVEEVAPGTDVIPTATIAWFMTRFRR